MNREEILAKAKNENKDEMEILVRDRSIRWTYLVMVIVAAVFAFIRECNGQPMMDLCVTVCASVTAGQWYRFAKTKDKYCLVMGVITLAVGIMAFVRYMMGH